VSDVEVSRTESLTRQEAAQRLSALATALAEGGHVKVQLGASTLKLHVPDHVRCEVEVEVDGDEVELELELKWSMAAAPAEPAAPATTARRHRRAAKASGPVSS
jgi:amphi-Trp domain-containing protein